MFEDETCEVLRGHIQAFFNAHNGTNTKTKVNNKKPYSNKKIRKDMEEGTWAPPKNNWKAWAVLPLVFCRRNINYCG